MKREEIDKIIYKAIDLLNEKHKGSFMLSSIQYTDKYTVTVKIIDEEIEEKARQAHISRLDLDPIFEVQMGTSYWWSTNLPPFDSAVGVAKKDLPLDVKTLLRVAWRILFVNKQEWRKKVFKKYPRLK